MSEKASANELSAADLRRLIATLRDYANILEESCETLETATERLGVKTIAVPLKAFEDDTLAKRTNGFVTKVQSKTRILKSELDRFIVRQINTAESALRNAEAAISNSGVTVKSVDELIDRLPKTQALMLRLVQMGLHPNEIAKQTNQPLKTVEDEITEARRQVLTLLRNMFVHNIHPKGIDPNDISKLMSGDVKVTGEFPSDEMSRKPK